MKKFWKTLISCLLVMMTALSICACKPKPAFDLDDAEDALKDAGYEVVLIKSPKEGDVEYAEAIDEYLRAYGEDDEYICMILFESSGMAKKYYKAILAEIEAEISYLESQIKVYEYYLKKYEDDMSSDECDEIEDEIKEMKKEIEEYEKEYCIGRKGKLVWYGDADAIEDTK